LSGIPGGYFDHQATSLFRFVLEYLKEPEPSYISHRPIERYQGAFGIHQTVIPSVIWTHYPCVHLFNTDSAVVFQQLISELEMEIPPLVAYFLMGFGDKDSCLSPAIRAFNPAREPLLPQHKQILRLLGEAGIVNLHAIGGCEKRLTANINPHNFIRGRQGNEGNIIAGKAGIPFSRGITVNGDGLDVALYWAGQPEFKLADISDGEVSAIKFPPRLFQGETVVPISTLEAGKTRLISILSSSEKPSVGSVKPLKGILKHLRTYLSVFRERNLQFGKLFNLVVAGYMPFVLFVDGYSLFKGAVVEVTAKIKPTASFLKSLTVGLKSVLKAFLPLHDFNIADLKKGGKPYRASPSVSPALKSGVLDGVFIREDARWN